MGGIRWTKEEDQLLRKCIEQYGEGKWHRVPLLAGLNRCRKSCRLRWLNYLRPNIKRGSFEEEEVDLIIKLHRLLGNRWSRVALRLPGRTGNDVKNYWNCHLSKKLNARETHEDKNNPNHARNKVIRPQPSSSASTSRSKRPSLVSLQALQSPSPNQPVEGSSSTLMPMPCNTIEDGQNQQIFQTDDNEDNKNISCLEEHIGINNNNNMVDYTMDMDVLPFDGQLNQNDDHIDQINYKWEWDDSILDDMDQWNES